MRLPTGMSMRQDATTLYRNSLASTSVVATDTGTGTNASVILFSPFIVLNKFGFNPNNLLEILSGTSSGTYSVIVDGKNTLILTPSSPDNPMFPLSAAEVTFRYSNHLYDNASASIYQDDVFVFKDTAVNFAQYSVQTTTNSGSPWKIVISNGPHPGTYTINDIINGSLVLNDWPSTSGSSGLVYQLQNISSFLIDSGVSGAITVSRRGRLETSNIRDDFGVVAGDYVLFSGTQYQVNGFSTGSIAYITGYTGGNVVGSASIAIYRRLVDSGKGYLNVKGMVLNTVTDYESSFGIVNGIGSIPDGSPNLDSTIRECYLVLIGSNYYKILEWSGNNITLSGTPLNWGLVGTSVDFSIVLFTKTSPITAGEQTFYKLDRGLNSDVYTISTETASPFMMRAFDTAVLNNSSGVIESISQNESIKITIEYKEDNE